MRDGSLEEVDDMQEVTIWNPCKHFEIFVSLQFTIAVKLHNFTAFHHKMFSLAKLL